MLMHSPKHAAQSTDCFHSNRSLQWQPKQLYPSSTGSLTPKVDLSATLRSTLFLISVSNFGTLLLDLVTPLATFPSAKLQSSDFLEKFEWSFM